MLCICALCAAAPAPSDAALRITRTISVGDGLAHETVRRILVDSRGFIWVATEGGLSRIDATGVRSFTPRDGLPEQSINDVFEDRRRRLWVATNGGGLAYLDDSTRGAPEPAFRAVRLGDARAINRVNVLAEDADGALLVGTDAGLWRVASGDTPTVAAVPLHAGTPDRLLTVWTVSRGRDGHLRVGLTAGLLEHWPDGRVVLHRLRGGPARQPITAMLADERGVWAVFDRVLVYLPSSAPPPADPRETTHEITPTFCDSQSPPSQAGRACVIAPHARTGLWNQDAVVALVRDQAGQLIAATRTGLFVVEQARCTEVLHLPSEQIASVTPAGDGSLWIGTLSAGALRAREGAVTVFDEAHGLARPRGARIFLDVDGTLHALAPDWTVLRFTGTRFERFQPPGAATWPSSGWDQVLRSRMGEWWMVTGTGILRYAARDARDLPRARRLSIIDRTTLPAERFRTIFEDARGDLWIGLLSHDGRTALARWERRTNRVHRYTAIDGVAPFAEAVHFVEDPAGQLWVGFRDGTLARHRDGTWSVLRTEGRLPGLLGIGRPMLVDRQRRLWLGFRLGVACVDTTPDRPPTLTPCPGAALLPDVSVTAMAQDARGRLYIGHARGVERLDPASNAVVSLGRDEGLPDAAVDGLVAGRDDEIWVATSRGVARLDSSRTLLRAAARPLFGRIAINGATQPVPAAGLSSIHGLVLGPGPVAIDVDVLGVPADVTPRPRFEFRLVRRGDEAWTRLPSDRSLSLAQIAPGRYRLELRALTGASNTGDAPAVMTFEIRAPLWQRPWTLALTFLAVTGAWWLFYRYRLQQIRHVERVRTRIATDLHDDIGASLSQIAILTELARQKGVNPAALSGLLDRVAATSRDLVDGMSDIVWAINPRRDSLGDLVKRMRLFAEDTLGASEVVLEFNASSHGALKLEADVRRELLLLCKEAVTNIARHAHATRARITLGVDGRRVRLIIADDGCGFDPGQAGDGNGLDNLRKRVRALDGQLTIDTAPGRGTTITVDLHARASRPRITTRLRRDEDPAPRDRVVRS